MIIDELEQNIAELKKQLLRLKEDKDIKETKRIIQDLEQTLDKYRKEQ